MDEQIKKHVASYFSCFYKLSTKWKTISDKTERPLVGFKNKAEQLGHIERADMEELEYGCDVKERLLFKVLIGIDEELRSLKLILDEFNISVQELKNKLHTLERSTVNIDWDNPKLISGSAVHPSLSDLLQLAYNGWRLYQDMYQNFTNILKSVDIRNANSVKNVNFVIKEQSLKQINEIIALTQYCYDS